VKHGRPALTRLDAHSPSLVMIGANAGLGPAISSASPGAVRIDRHPRGSAAGCREIDHHDIRQACHQARQRQAVAYALASGGCRDPLHCAPLTHRADRDIRTIARFDDYRCDLARGSLLQAPAWFGLRLKARARRRFRQPDAHTGCAAAPRPEGANTVATRGDGHAQQIAAVAIAPAESSRSPASPSRSARSALLG